MEDPPLGRIVALVPEFCSEGPALGQYILMMIRPHYSYKSSDGGPQRVIHQFPHMHHKSFPNTSFASPTSQALHLIHLASSPCKAEMIAFTDCDYCNTRYNGMALLQFVTCPDRNFHCVNVCIFTIRICNFSKFVVLCTDDTDTPVSCDKCFRDILGVCSNLLPISFNVRT